MEYGLLLLRVVVGLVFVGLGAQKLFGSFGGRGPAGTAAILSSLGYRAPAKVAIVFGLMELVGGLLLGVGLLTPLAGLLIAVLTLDTIATVTFRRRFLGGYDREVTLMAVAVGLTATGPGRISLDRAIGWDDNITGIAWASAVLGSAIVISLVITTIGRARADLDELPDLKRSSDGGGRFIRP